MPATVTLYTRPQEVLLHVIREDAGVCTYCDKPIAEAMFCWDHRITTGPARDGTPFRLGEDRFSRFCHTDGTPGHGDDLNCCWPKPCCSKCGSYRLQTKQEAYGDLTTCLDCGHESWVDIGD